MTAALRPSSVDTKKHILHLIERYGTERAQEALADSRDASMVTLNRHSERIDKAMGDIGAEIDRLMAGGEK